MNIPFSRTDIYKKSGIYAIKNTVNDRLYIGSSNNLYKRLNAHYNFLKSGNHVNKALSSFCAVHGFENLYVEIVEFCDKSILIEKENFYIQKYKAYGHGFNCSPKAESPNIGFFSEETRKKLSIKRKQYIEAHKEENNDRLNKGRLISSAMRKNGQIPPSNLGKKASAETRLKQSLAKKGKPSHLNQDAWEKIRAKHKEKCSGSKSHYAKLKEEDVLKIREMILNEGKSRKDVAAIFNVSTCTMHDIIKRKSWKHI